MTQIYITTKEAASEYRLNLKLVKKFVGSLSPEFKIKKAGNLMFNQTINEFLRLKKYGRNGCITQTTALYEFKLKKKDLEGLVYTEMKNPHYSQASPMKLFLKDEVQEYKNNITSNEN